MRDAYPSTDHLDDTQLLAKESKERDDFRRLEEAEPRFRDTTFGLRPGSAALVDSWDRWWDTKEAARRRGLVTTGDRRMTSGS